MTGKVFVRRSDAGVCFECAGFVLVPLFCLMAGYSGHCWHFCVVLSVCFENQRILTLQSVTSNMCSSFSFSRCNTCWMPCPLRCHGTAGFLARVMMFNSRAKIWFILLCVTIRAWQYEQFFLVILHDHVLTINYIIHEWTSRNRHSEVRLVS